MKKLALSILAATGVLLSSAPSFAKTVCSIGDYRISIKSSSVGPMYRSTLELAQLIGGDAWGLIANLNLTEIFGDGTIRPAARVYGSEDSRYLVRVSGPSASSPHSRVAIYRRDRFFGESFLGDSFSGESPLGESLLADTLLIEGECI